MNDLNAAVSPGFSTDMPTLSVRPTLPADERAQLIDILDKMRHQPGALLPILHAVQETLGCIPPAAVGDIAQALNLSRAEVHGVITFYPHFSSEPRGRFHIQTCRAESCQAMGSEALLHHAVDVLGCLPGQTRADGNVSLEPVYCLGLCAQSPAISINGKMHAKVDCQKFDDLLAGLGACP